MSKPIIFGAIAVVVLIIIAQSTYTLRETEQGIVLQLGKKQGIVQDSGLHFKVPFLQNVVIFDKRILDFDAALQEVPTADQKQLVIDSYARYKITDPYKFYQTVQNENGLKVRLDSIINSSLREIIGSVPMAQILTPERSNIIGKFATKVADSTRELGVEVIDVRINRIDLPAENSQAIFKRMQSQREQEARKIRAEGDAESSKIKAEADKQKRVIVAEARRTSENVRGQGDKQAQKIYSEAYGRDPEFFDFWRSMQAMVRSLRSDNTTMVMPSDNDFFRYFRSEKPK